MNVIVSGLMTSYQKVGKGKVLVLLPGWGNSIADFMPLVNELKDKYQLLILDLPGFGGTQAPDKTWGLENYSNFVAEWLKKIGIKDVCAFIGHSYGGAVEIVGLAKNDLSSQKLVLLASAGIRNKATLRKQVFKVASKTAKIPLNLLPAAKQRQIKQKVYGAIGSDMMLIPHMEQTFRKIISQDVREDAKKIKQPTLLIYGDKDKATPISDARILSESIANSSVEILSAGHHLHQDAPDRVASLIINFLETK